MIIQGTLNPFGRPVVTATLSFPALGVHDLQVEMLLDTGADATILSPRDSKKIADLVDPQPGVDPPPDWDQWRENLDSGSVLAGVGGGIPTRKLRGVLSFGRGYRRNIVFQVIDPRPHQLDEAEALPSMLGRDVLRDFALLFAERLDLVALWSVD